MQHRGTGRLPAACQTDDCCFGTLSCCAARTAGCGDQVQVQLLMLLALLQVRDRAASDFMLGTAYKAKGQEEYFVQLASDFTDIAGKPKPDQLIDERNLLRRFDSGQDRPGAER